MQSFPPEKLYPNAEISPEQFELLVMNKFNKLYPHVEILHRENLKGVDGEYNIDLSIRFQELGVNFLVLVECKHHRYPIKRDYVQLLRDKVDSLGAQKGILVSSSSFQLGAIEYAKIHNIALIRLINEEFMYERRSREFLEKVVPPQFSGNIALQLIESLSASSLRSSIIDNFNELLGISEK
ncbi:restriction endonuclease [Brevibacillus formosus]|uniref:restriction endonuclease n=1 Tax=Brevibacillus formosus TaxID=54913 RepID=UPI003F1DE0C3